VDKFLLTILAIIHIYLTGICDYLKGFVEK